MRMRAAGWLVLSVATIVAAVVSQLASLPEAGRPRVPQGHEDPQGHERARRADEVSARFQQAVVMLHAKQYEHAATALHRVLELAPDMPEAHVDMGYAMLGLQQFDAAHDFFQSAIELRPSQANAYYGLAMVAEAHKDLESALGAMRAYLHLSRADDAHRARARAAIWEWEETLGRTHAAAAGPVSSASTQHAQPDSIDNRR